VRARPDRLFMSDLDMDAAAPPLDLSHTPLDVIACVLQSMSLIDRFTCALVCKSWAAAAATRSIVLRDREQDLSCLQAWLEKHGGQVEVLQLHKCRGTLIALPCPQLQDLLLHGLGGFTIDSRVWGDIKAANKLTSVSIADVFTPSQQADVVSALTALPDLEQLNWLDVCFESHEHLSDGLLLLKLTKLTALDIFHVEATEALEHLGLLTRLQDLRLCGQPEVAGDWGAAGCPGLQELKALTRLELLDVCNDIPDSVSQLTALQKLDVSHATPTALNRLQVLTGLTQVWVERLTGLSPESLPLQLPGLHHLVFQNGAGGTMPMSFLASCTQLRVLELCYLNVSSPGSLVAGTMLQSLKLHGCRLTASAADGAAGPVSWQHVFPGPAQLPHLTSLRFEYLVPDPEQADIECIVACCSSLQVLYLDTRQPASGSFLSALAQLSGLTSLLLRGSSDQQCSSLAQLTGLRELRVHPPGQLSVVGLRQLAALQELTSLGFMNPYTKNLSPVLQEQMSDKLPDYAQGIINKVRGEGPSYN